MNNSIFLEIMNSCGEKKIISRCKKLDKKNALTSGAVATTLAELAYWLYIYDHEEEALMVCEFSHIDMPKAYKVNYNVWDYILWIWGLEAYIYRKKGNNERCESIIQKMISVWNIPSVQGEDSAEQIEKSNMEKFNRFTFEDAIYAKKISDAVESRDKTLANGYRFDSLYEMIGYGVTGLYPHLEEHKEELETKIEEYINFLK